MMYDIDKLSPDDVMREVWQNKAAVAAEFPTWADYLAHSKKLRIKLEAEGWYYSSPQEQNGEKAAAPQSV
jgi:hypothetical protein